MSLASSILSFPLALSKCDQSLLCSLHKISNPFKLARKLKLGNVLALMDARRLVSVNQLICAANLAVHRTSPTWDTVFLAAASGHIDHVLRDYAFWGEEYDGDHVVVIFQVSLSGRVEDYMQLLEQNELVPSMMPGLRDYFTKQQETSRAQLQKWYKLTDHELDFSLEDCILTKVATKMV